MTTTTTNASSGKPAEGRQQLRNGTRRLDPEEVDRIAARRVRIELEARQEMSVANKLLSPAMVGTGILAGVAFVFSVMTWLNETTQDKVDKATGPLVSRISEMDRRITHRLDAVDARIERLEVRVDKQFENTNTKIENINAKIENIDAKFDLLLKRR